MICSSFTTYLKKNRNLHSLCFHCFLIVGSGSFYCSVCQVCLKTGHQRYTQSWQWKSILMSSKPNDGLPIIQNGFLNSTLIMCTIKNVSNINNFVFEVFQRCLPKLYFFVVLQSSLCKCQPNQYHEIKFTYSPVVLQWASGEGTFVGGILVFPAPAQNQPFTLMGCKCSASHPLPLKLHFRPEV